MSYTPQLQHTVEVAGHTSAWTAFVGWFFGILPSIATLVTIAWFSILIIEKIVGKPFHEIVRCVWRKLLGKTT